MKSMSKRLWCLFRFIILIQCKKMLLCIKTSFVWLKKIGFFYESLYEIVLLLIQFFFLHVVASVLVGLCNVLSDLRFFLFICWFFSMTWWNTITDFFSPLFFLWDFLWLVSLRWGRFFCRMNWIVCWLSCRRICFFLFHFFFEWD